MNFYEYQNCCDFSTAILNQPVSLKEIGMKIADSRGLSSFAAERFSQGYTHCHQGRTDLLGACRYYDDGYAAAAA